MKIISQLDCEEWLSNTHGRPLTRDGLRGAIETEYAFCAVYRLPTEALKMTALASMVALYSFCGTEPGLFWITDWGIYPSAERMAIFDGYRMSLGEGRSLFDAPGHILDESDLTELECLLCLSLYFYWDAGLFESAGTVAVSTSHDGYICVRANCEERMKLWQGNLDRLGLERLR